MITQRTRTGVLYKYLVSIAAAIIVVFSTPHSVFADSTVASEEAATSSTEPVNQITEPVVQQTSDVEIPTNESSAVVTTVLPEASTSEISTADTTSENSISNNTIVESSSGNANVALNTTAGDATSGESTATVSVVNLLQSSLGTSSDTPAITLYVQDIHGNVTGDITLNPQLSSTTSQPATLKVNSSNSSSINNTIEVNASSGDARVAYNTDAGDATSGDASIVANVVNAINSSISSGSTFIGIINIFGNLNGDILLPQEVLSALLGGGTQPTNVPGTQDSNIQITNDIEATATSGDAKVIGNTSAGSATSGDAQTSVKIINLTGRQIIGSNALLVFVNVLGTWVGMIVDAPAGSTSSVLAGGESSAENASNTVNGTETLSITNSIKATATTGDALVLFNTLAGNATSGDSSVAINILNIVNTQLHVSDWLGVLFINVFGNWFGSFGLNTEAGSPPSPNVVSALAPEASSKEVTSNTRYSYKATYTTDTYSPESASETVLADATIIKASPSINTGFSSPKADSAPIDWLIPVITLAFAAILFAVERYFAGRETK